MLRLIAAVSLCFCLVGLAPAAEKTPAPKAAADKTPADHYELYKVLIDAVDQVERNYVKEVDRRELMEAALRGVLSKLDPYSSYISPQEIDRFRTSVGAEFGGIGIQVTIEEGRLKIISPLVGTPGYRAGLLAGDRIVEIDGASTEGLSLDDAIHKLKGPEGSKVALTVIHPGRHVRQTITVVREKIHIDSVLGDGRKPDDTWDFMLKREPRIGYIRLTAFSRESPKELRKALDELKREQMQGLILDLRFNPGGLLSVATEVAGTFIASGRIVSTQGRNSPERVWDAKKDGAYEGFPMVILVNRYSASASEIVAACLQDHKRAVIIGERTWGKGSVQNVIDLEGGQSAIKLTTAAYKRPSGKNIHRFEGMKDDEEWGVTPDKGFEIKLADGEVAGLLQDRRKRDILKPKSVPEDAPATAKKPEANDAAPQDKKGEPEAKATDAVKEPAPDKGKPDEKGDREEKKADVKKPEENGKTPEVVTVDDPVVVDRQLEAAVKYLTEELGKKSEIRSTKSERNSNDRSAK